MLLLKPISVRGLFCSIAADRHAAPPSGMPTSSIDEEKRARGSFAGLHLGEIFRADEVRQRSRQWKEQRLG